MANNIDGKNNYIDTWTSDITIASLGTSAILRKVILHSAAAGDKLYLEDGLGHKIALLRQKNANRCETEDFYGQSFNGLQIDVSDCTGLGSGDEAWIYLE